MPSIKMPTSPAREAKERREDLPLPADPAERARARRERNVTMPPSDPAITAARRANGTPKIFQPEPDLGLKKQ